MQVGVAGEEIKIFSCLQMLLHSEFINTVLEVRKKVLSAYMIKMKKCYGGNRTLSLCFPLDKFWLVKRRENLWMRTLRL